MEAVTSRPSGRGLKKFTSINVASYSFQEDTACGSEAGSSECGSTLSTLSEKDMEDEAVNFIRSQPDAATRAFLFSRHPTGLAEVQQALAEYNALNEYRNRHVKDGHTGEPRIDTPAKHTGTPGHRYRDLAGRLQMILHNYSKADNAVGLELSVGGADPVLEEFKQTLKQISEYSFYSLKSAQNQFAARDRRQQLTGNLAKQTKARAGFSEDIQFMPVSTGFDQALNMECKNTFFTFELGMPAKLARFNCRMSDNFCIFGEREGWGWVEMEDSDNP